MNRLIKIVLFLVILFLSYLSLNIGVERIDFSEINIIGTLSNTLFYKSRLPRTISIIIAGFGISLSGLIFQHISRNKFVSPTTSGSVSGAQLGVAITMVLFSNASTITMMIVAFITSLGTTLLFMNILGKLRLKSIIFIPLLGVMLGGVIKSITTLIAYRFNFLQVLEGWFYGSFSLVISGRYEVLYIIVPALILTFIYAKAFAIVGMGRDFSINLGIKYKVIINIGLVLISIINASTVIVIGSIPFLGLVIPNIVTIIMGDNLNRNILSVGMSGVIFLFICDIFARTVRFPFELPVGIVVGILGCGIFLTILLKRGAK